MGLWVRPAASSFCIASTASLAPPPERNMKPRDASSKQAGLGTMVSQFRKLRFPLRMRTAYSTEDKAERKDTKLAQYVGEKCLHNTSKMFSLYKRYFTLVGQSIQRTSKYWTKPVYKNGRHDSFFKVKPNKLDRPPGGISRTSAAERLHEVCDMITGFPWMNVGLCT